MKKLINHITLLMAVFLLIAVSACQPDPVRYASSPEQLLEALQQSDFVLSPEAARQVVQAPAESQLLIDLRSPAEFEKGHIEGALNIPSQDLLLPETLVFFSRKDAQFILYGEDQAQANGPWLFLQQLGVENVKVLPGGYRYFSGMDNSATLTLAETPDHDYAAVFTAAVERHKKEAEAVKPKPVVVPQKKIVPKPKKKKVEEEEGC